jgi:lipoprotein-anchoring transpeptidase ErfK/SrfK
MPRLLALTALLLLALAAPAAAQEQRIAAGTKAGHLDVGGLTVNEAIVKLQQSYNASLGRPLSVHVAGHRYGLTMSQAKLKFDAPLTARRALRAPRRDVALALSWDHKVVRKLTDRIAAAAYRAPRNATVRITLRHMIRRPSHSGRSLDANALRGTVEAAIANPDPASSRVIKPKRKVVKAKVTTRNLARRYPAVVTIDRAHFKLRLFKRLKFVKSYGVAVGQPAYPTPTGLYSITNKQVNPAWTAPNSPWAGELAGSTTPGGSASNPLKARWMGIVNGVGIHGTGEDWSIGSRASHGCIRMHVSDVVDLYPRVPIGSPVLIR